jgi:hypothetical protein
MQTWLHAAVEIKSPDARQAGPGAMQSWAHRIINVRSAKRCCGILGYKRPEPEKLPWFTLHFHSYTRVSEEKVACLFYQTLASNMQKTYCDPNTFMTSLC